MCGHLLGGYPGRCKSPVTKHVNSADCENQCTSFAPCIGYSHSNITYPQACVIITSTAWSCPYNPGAPYDYVDGAIASTASELIATTMMTGMEGSGFNCMVKPGKNTTVKDFYNEETLPHIQLGMHLLRGFSY